MARSLLFYLKLFSLCFVGVTVALEQTGNTLKRSRREALENQNFQSGKSGKDKESADGIKINDNRRNQRPKNVKKLHNRRRCFLGSPYDCPVGFEDSLLDWPRPWGWGPGPLYPEYGPDLHRCSWGGPRSPFGCNQCGCGGPWRVPGCACGCGNHGWCCKSFIYIYNLAQRLKIILTLFTQCIFWWQDREKLKNNQLLTLTLARVCLSRFYAIYELISFKRLN